MRNDSPMRLCLSLVAAFGLLGVTPLHAQGAATATVTCKDGSSSNAGKGACSHHGGVNKGAAASDAATSTASPATAAKSAPTAAAPTASSTAPASNNAMTSSAASPKGTTSSPATAAKAAPTASAATSAGTKSTTPTAKCKDGTMSYSMNHSGSCSHHGGVAQFLDK